MAAQNTSVGSFPSVRFTQRSQLVAIFKTSPLLSWGRAAANSAAAFRTARRVIVRSFVARVSSVLTVEGAARV